MKNHNLLWVVFLLFMVVCIIAYSMGEFASWKSVVTAVAVASAFLSYADFFMIHSTYYQDACDRGKTLVITATKKIEKQKDIIDELLIKVYALRSENVNASKDETSFKKIKEACLEIEGYILELKAINKNKDDKQKKYGEIGEVLIVIAFLSFLCIMAFETFAETLQNAQEIISVLSFAVILSSQYVNALYANKRKKDNDAYDKVVNSLDAVHEQMYDTQNKFYRYYGMTK